MSNIKYKINSNQQFLLILFFLILNIEDGFSQTQQAPYELMLNAYQQLDYQTAKRAGQTITANYNEYSLFQLVETHKILGVIAYTEGNADNAKTQFEQALSIDDKTQLDSVYVSPKIIQFFNDLKQAFVQSKREHDSDTALSSRYILVSDPRPAASMRSLVLPGWGQLYKHEKKKGYGLMTTAGISFIATGILHVLQKNAHNEYLNATDLEIINEKYDQYNQLYKWRNGAALFTGAIWVYSFFDALIHTNEQSRTQQVASLKMLRSRHNGVMVSAEFRF